MGWEGQEKGKQGKQETQMKGGQGNKKIWREMKKEKGLHECASGIEGEPGMRGCYMSPCS